MRAPAVGGGAVGAGGVIENHLHVYLDGKEITTTVKRELYRTQQRNGTLGFT